MRRSLVAALSAMFIFTPLAGADEVGGSGFSVPQQQSEWLWGIEGLTRTPVDLAMNIGGSWYNYESDARLRHFDNSGVASQKGNFNVHWPGSIQGGIRLSGGLGYWSCCVMIEPAMAIWGNRPLGSDQADRGPIVFDPDDGTGDEFTNSQVEIMETWDIGFGPQMTYIIQADTPLFGSLGLEGLPLVFFPFMGVSHSEWDVEIAGFDDGFSTGNADRNFTDDFFMIGFNIDFPLPGSHGPFTHNLTFGFKWVNADDHGHHMTVGVTNPGNTQILDIKEFEGYRLEISYQITWNDFEGFFKRNLFGPVN